MKYIRTCEGKIIDVEKAIERYKERNVDSMDKQCVNWMETDIIKCIVNGSTDCDGYKRRAIKEADDIEELCDEFVFVDEFGKKDLLDDNCKAKLQECGTFSVVHALMKQDKPKELYGAIWTNKGLIYVAKMNKKLEMELL